MLLVLKSRPCKESTLAIKRWETSLLKIVAVLCGVVVVPVAEMPQQFFSVVCAVEIY